MIKRLIILARNSPMSPLIHFSIRHLRPSRWIPRCLSQVWHCTRKTREYFCRLVKWLCHRTLNYTGVMFHSRMLVSPAFASRNHYDHRSLRHCRRFPFYCREIKKQDFFFLRGRAGAGAGKKDERKKKTRRTTISDRVAHTLVHQCRVYPRRNVA